MNSAEINNLPILATVVDMIGAITLQVVGEDAAAEVNGQKITPSSVRALAVSNLNLVLSENSND